MSLMKKFKNGKRGRQKGNALVMVILAIAFIGMLVAMIVYSAYGNYLMKYNDTRAKDNFYSAESVLDIVNAGMQVDISDAMLDAYTYVMELSTDEMTALGLTREALFRQRFTSAFKHKLQETPAGDSWNVDYFIELYKRGMQPGMAVAASAGSTGAYIEAGDDPSLSTDNAITTSDTLITIKNFRVTYTNTNGYVSVIQTDVRISIPEMTNTGVTTTANLDDFCLIANDAVVSDVNYPSDAGVHYSPEPGSHASGPINLKVGGDVNAGRQGLYVRGSKVEFTYADGEETTTKYYLVTNDMTVEDSDSSHGLNIKDNYTTYANDIVVRGTSLLDIDGTIYAQDDLDINGRNNRVNVSGYYYGYGSDYANSSTSSSILVNGANTTLDMSGLNELILGGNSFIGATSYDADSVRYDGVYGAGKSDDDDEIIKIETYNKALNDNNLLPTPTTPEDTYVPQNNKDLLMGGAMGARAEQMLYLIPANCIGYDKTTNEMWLGKNPMSRDEFERLKNTTYTDPVDGLEKPRYDVVSWSQLGSANTTKYKAVYRRINGTVLVYLYLDFEAEEQNAAAFLKGLYEEDPLQLDSLIAPYYNKVNSTFGTTLLTKNGDDYPNLSLRGNLFYYDNNGDLQMIENNVNTSAIRTSRLQDLSTNKAEEYFNRLYTTQPTVAPSDLTDPGVFENIVKTDKISSAFFSTTRVFDKLWTGSGSSISISGDSPGYKAIVVDGDYTFGASADNDIIVIVASGNIYLDKDFNGLAIAGKNIVIGPMCTNINRKKTPVKTALKNLAIQNGSSVIKLSDMFVPDVGRDESMGGTGSVSDEERLEDSNRSLGKYITYTNWRKE